MKRRMLLQLLGLCPASAAGMLPALKFHHFSAKDHSVSNGTGQPAAEIQPANPRATGLNLSTGLGNLDGITGGIRPGEVWLIAGQHCMGKTALGLHIARHINKQQNSPVLFTTITKTYEEIGKIFGKTDNVRIVHFNQQWKTSEAHNRQALKSSSIFVDDDITLTAIDVVRNINRLYENFGYRSLCRLAVIDDLTLVAENSGAASPEFSACSAYELSYITKSFGIPLILMATTEFNPQERADPRTRISDLKFLGPFARMADKILLLYRDEIYKPTGESHFPGTVEVSLVRNRHGRCGTTLLDINGVSLSDCDIPALFERM